MAWLHRQVDGKNALAADVLLKAPREVAAPCGGRRNIGTIRALFSVELSRSAAVVWLVRTPTARRWKGGGMAHESPPSRASPRPLAGVLGCLTAAGARAVVVTPSSGLFLVVRS